MKISVRLELLFIKQRTEIFHHEDNQGRLRPARFLISLGQKLPGNLPAQWLVFPAFSELFLNDFGRDRKPSGSFGSFPVKTSKCM